MRNQDQELLRNQVGHELQIILLVRNFVEFTAQTNIIRPFELRYRTTDVCEDRCRLMNNDSK